jgi:hypothetical protein
MVPLYARLITQGSIEAGLFINSIAQEIVDKDILDEYIY